jgi:hypothetical protein
MKVKILLLFVLSSAIFLFAKDRLAIDQAGNILQELAAV